MALKKMQSGGVDFGKKVLYPLVLKKRQKRYQKWKRLADMLFAVIVLMTVFLLLLVIGIAIKIEEPSGKIFFTQTRVGKDGHAFEMIKLLKSLI